MIPVRAARSQTPDEGEAGEIDGVFGWNFRRLTCQSAILTPPFDGVDAGGANKPAVNGELQ
jgi:hypothetical protein